MRIVLALSFFFTINVLQLFSQGFYDVDHVTTIEITFEEDNWDQILKDFYAAGDNERLLAFVKIDGKAYDSVGVRYRGGGTFNPSNAKNPLNIKLDDVKNQHYEGYTAIKLSNGAKDPSMLREVMTFEIARKYMEAPYANYTNVFVNGNYHGLYVNFESINSKFFSERFQSSSSNARFECSPKYSWNSPPTVPPFGCTTGSGSVLEYLGNGIICYFDHYQIQSSSGWNDLRDMAQVLKDDPANARQVLDLDRFIWMCALNSLLANLDSYLGAGSRNYYMGKADNGRFVPIPDDMNESFGRFPWTEIPQPGDPQPPLSFYAQLDPFLGAGNDKKPLLKAIFGNPVWKRMYTAHLRTMIAEIFTSGWFEQRAEELQNLISGPLLSDSNHFYTYGETMQNLNNTVVDFYNGEDAYGLIPLMDGRIQYLSGLPEFQAQQPGIGAYAASPAIPQPGTQVTITAPVSNASQVMLGYRNNIKEMFDLVPMFDDGAHGDGAAGDGVYGAFVPVGAGGIQFYMYAENALAGRFSPERAEFEYHQIGAAGDVVINEFMAANQSTVTDQNGEYDDWIEFYNNTNSTINLSGWYLTDNPQNLTKWQFPNGVFIAPGEYLIVWADGDTSQAGLHASFSLSAAGEVIVLLSPNLTIVDQIVFGPQQPDISMARCPNGTGSFLQAPPTFAADNTPACLTVGTDEMAGPSLHFYPNPANDFLILQSSILDKTRVRIQSVLGQTHLEAAFSGSTELDLSRLAPGLYFIQIEGKTAGKLMIVR